MQRGSTASYGKSMRPMRAYDLGCLLLMTMGGAHLAGHDILVTDLGSERATQVLDGLRAMTFSLLGVTRTLEDSLVGFSLAMTIFPFFLGLLARTSGAALIHATGAVPKSALLPLIAASATALLLSLLYLPVPPMLLSAAALLCFTLALRQTTRET